MIEKLRKDADKIPSPSRDDIMVMAKSIWGETVSNVDVNFAFKRNALTIKLDGTEDHLVSNKLKALVWDEMTDFRKNLLRSPHPDSLKKLEGIMIPPDGVKRKLCAAIDSVPTDEGCELLDGDYTDDEYDRNEESDDEGESDNDDQSELRPEPSEAIRKETSDNETTQDPEVKADLECLSRIESMISAEKRVSSTHLLPFFVKVENTLAKERQRCRMRDQKKEIKANQTSKESNNENDADDANAFDIFNE